MKSRHSNHQKRGPRPIEEQVQTLAAAFSLSADRALTFIATELPQLTLPSDADRWFAILSPTTLERASPTRCDADRRYYEGLYLIFQRLTQSCSFTNNALIPLYKRRLFQRSETIAAIDQVAQRQKGDILIIPANIGFGGGTSLWRSGDKSFGLRSSEVACIILSNLESLRKFENLEIECAGDEVNPECGSVKGVPCFRCKKGMITYYVNELGCGRNSLGTGYGFFP
jgi:hypothetical protein